MNLFEGIRESYLSHGLSDEEVGVVAQIAEDVCYEDLKEVIREFDDANDVFILLEGKLRVTTSSGDPIARLKPGSVVGEISVFDSGKRSASVVAEGNARLARFSANDLNELISGRPEIGIIILRNIGHTLCERLRSSNIQLESVLAAL